MCKTSQSSWLVKKTKKKLSVYATSSIFYIYYIVETVILFFEYNALSFHRHVLLTKAK